MSILDLFKSSKDTADEKRRAERRAKRKAEQAIENLQDKNSALTKECNQLWEKARQQLMSGQKAAAAATLKIYKSKLAMATRNEKQFIMARHQTDIMNNAAMMNELSGALKDLAVISNIDPDAVAENMENIDAANDDINEANRIMEKSYDRSMAKLDKDLDEAADTVGDDELMKVLESETAGTVMGPRVTEATGEIPTADEINSGRDNLNKLLNNN
ncbi:MAG: hypothetical protein IKD44_04260 [Lentisphaeria bacterium]|nr:hypothetical protein [Lentisphaeria bacterium]